MSWSLMHRRQFCKVAGSAAVGVIAGTPSTVYAQRIILPNVVDKQLNDWISEPGGLLEWINDPGEQADPANTTSRADLGGLTLMEYCEAQVTLLNLLRSNVVVQKRNFSPAMIIVAEDIRNSYNSAPEADWVKDQQALTRTVMRDLMNQALLIAERPIIDPVLKRPPTRAQGQSSGTQYALPISDQTNNWKQECAGDADASAFDELDEGFGSGRGSGSGPDDATSWWVSNGGPVNEALITNLGSVTDPASSTGHIFRGRSVKATSSCSLDASGSQVDVKMILLQTVTEIASQNFTNINDSWTTRAVTLTAGEADNITDYTALRISTEANKVGGGSPRSAGESAHEFECPDATTARKPLLFTPF